MTLSAGTRLGPYEILAPIGAGGMGEVYKAKDTRLDRTVAVKVLPSHLSADADLKARFEREARAISQLTHPHICTLHDVGNADGVEYLVMELLEGQTLAERLEKGPLPVEQVLKFGVEIADALDKAHRAGIVHRDLKPGNVMLTKSGVKLLDFGLAKAVGLRTDGSDLSSLPTEAERPLTERGTILGTFQYMSPEQLEGKEADARSDIFAFGCVLYEMATGKKAFSGASRVSLISSILRDDPRPISTVAPMTPPALDRVVKTCLAKDPEDRWQSAHDVKSELAWIAEAGSQAGAPAMVLAKRKRLGRLTWAVLAWLAIVAGVLAVLFVGVNSRLRSEEGKILRTQLLPPRGERLFFNLGRTFAISPDGSRVVYSIQKGASSELRIRALDSDESTVIPGSEGGFAPFFSPDGKWIGFAAGSKLKKVALAGGTPITLCDAPIFRGAAWGEDGSIYFIPNMYVPISRIPADGGPAKTVTKIRTNEGEQLHRWPELLPGGKVILYAIGYGTDWDQATIVAERLGTGERKILIKGGTYPRYLPTGHLVYARDRSLYAVSFDADSLKVEGSPVEVARNVLLNASGFAQADISRNGLLIAAPANSVGGEAMLSWIDREGRAEPLKVPHNDYLALALSHEGDRVALSIGNGMSVLDLGRLSMTKLSLPARAEDPTWSRDGRRVFFGLEKEKFYQIFSKAADDSGVPQLLAPSDCEEDPLRVSPDGSKLLYARTLPDGLNELCVRAIAGGSSENVRGLLTKSAFLDAVVATFSADGRFVAYQSEESGRPEVYVRPSSGEDRKWQVSTEGGAYPIWSPTGNEIFYLCGRKFLATPVSVKGEEPTIGAPHVLFDNHEIISFDVSRDGKRFLVAEDPNPGAQTSLDLTVHWFAEVRRKLREAKTP